MEITNTITPGCNSKKRHNLKETTQIQLSDICVGHISNIGAVELIQV